MKNNTAYLWITIAVLIGIFIPSIVQDGMFFDGVTYSAISKNLSNGIGSYFNPHYTKTLYPEFHEHPPLVFIIQSWYFDIFGDSFLTERIYGFCTILLTLLGIGLTWKLMSYSTEMKKSYWLPILFFVFVPIIPWAYKNNVLENTMGVFTIFSVFFTLKSIRENKPIYLILGASLIILAFLSKGAVSLFPLILPLIYAVIFQEFKKSGLHFMGLLASFTFISIMIYFMLPELRENLLAYFDKQLLPALNNEREINVNYRLKILVDLLLDLGILVAIALFFFIRSKIKKTTHKLTLNKRSLLFLFIGLSASVPLIISLKQSKIYLVPSIPFFALAFAFLLYNPLKIQMDKLTEKTIKWIKLVSIIAIISVLLLSNFKFGNYSRDEDKLGDVYKIAEILPEGTILKTTDELWLDWSLVAYMSRVGYISLDQESDRKYLLLKSRDLGNIPDGYKLVNADLLLYTLYQKE